MRSGITGVISLFHSLTAGRGFECNRLIATVSPKAAFSGYDNHMNLKDIQQTVASLEPEQRVRWLIDLGWAMTVAARGCYPLAQQADPVPHLMAFNEMQHQLFSYLRDSGNKDDDWTLDAFLDGLWLKAKVSGVEGDLGWALNWALERLASGQ